MSNWSNAGRVRPVSKGTWSSTVAYTVLDLVTSSDKLRSYIATQNVPAGTPLTNTAYWQVLVDATAINDTENSLMDRLASPFNESGSIVTCHPVEGYSLKTKTLVKPAQSGSGDPSPSNIRPISGRTSAELTRCGVNLFKPSFIGTRSANGMTCTLNAIGAATLNGTATGTAIFNIYDGANFFDPNKDYSLSYTSKYAEAANAEMGVWCIDASGAGKYAAATANAYKVTFRIPADAVKVQIRIRLTAGATFENFLFPVYLNEGTEIIGGKYYEGETFSVSFGQTVYGGTLDWNTGILTVDRAIREFTGTEGWSKSGSTEYDRFILTVSGMEAPQQLICSHAHSNLDPDFAFNRCEITAASLFAWNYSAHGETTVTDFKTYLSKQKAAGTPVQIAYKLATPTTIQLTPAQILALKGTNSLYSDCGDTAVFGRIDPEWMNEQFRNAIIALGGNV